MAAPYAVPDPFDIQIGLRLRRLRLKRGLSQEALAATLGVTFQQVQRYESGKNRLAASGVFLMAQALDVSVRALFDGCAQELGGGSYSTEEAEEIADLWLRLLPEQQELVLRTARALAGREPHDI